MSYLVNDVLGVVLRDAAEDEDKEGWHIVGRVQNAQPGRSVTLEILGHVKPATLEWEASSESPRNTTVIALSNLVELSHSVITEAVAHEASTGGINFDFADESRETIP